MRCPSNPKKHVKSSFIHSHIDNLEQFVNACKGFGWYQRALLPASDEFVNAQKEYYLHTIECFGPNRCMFESNFPVDRLSISYHVVWNGFKKIVAEFSEDEKDMMFSGTATRVYKL